MPLQRQCIDCVVFLCFRALKIGLLSRDMIDEYDPALMFTIPRLAIIRFAVNWPFLC